jgi:hypothetical protein
MSKSLSRTRIEETAGRLVILLLAAASCGGPPAESIQPQPVAEAALGNGVRLEMFALPDGAFVVSQAGPMGSAPVPFDRTLIRQRDPRAIWQQL